MPPGLKSFLSGVFPESDWKELDAQEYEKIHGRLGRGGARSLETLKFLQDKKVKLGIFPQKHSGGGWTLFRNITISPDESLDHPYTLSLVIHETFHLQQSLFTRLSVYGELLAWQYQKEAYREVSGKEIGEIGEAYPGKKNLWDELAGLNPESRDDLSRAQELMKKIAIGYRSDRLPLYPLGKEIRFYFGRGDVRGCWEMVRRLVGGR